MTQTIRLGDTQSTLVRGRIQIRLIPEQSLILIAVKTRYRFSDNAPAQIDRPIRPKYPSLNECTVQSVDIIHLIPVSSDIKGHFEPQLTNMIVVTQLQLHALIRKIHDVLDG